VLEAATNEAKIDLPDKLIHARAHELLEQTFSSLARQGINKDTYLKIVGKDEEELAHDAEPDAASALRREAMLAAVVAAEDIQPTDDELVEALRPAAERDGSDPAELVDKLRKSGRLDSLREDVAARQAVDLLVRDATPISVEQAKARQKLWTPGKDEAEGEAAPASALWTPGS
jgi:trigger factor